MNHLFFNIIIPLLSALFVAHVAFVIGKMITSFLKIDLFKKSILSNSVSVLLGYGVIGYFSLILSLIGPLHKISIIIILCVVLSLGYKSIFALYREIYIGIRTVRHDFFEKFLLASIIFCFIFYFTSAFVPPYRTDALAYHLPEAIQIAEQGMRFEGLEGSFFPNLPILMETLYALLYTVSGFTLIHISHYFLTIAGLFFIYGFIRYFFNQKAALLSIAGIFTIYELFVGATNAYIDAAMIMYEITGFLILVIWMKTQHTKLLFLSGILYGFAISIKYNALYGLVIACILSVSYALYHRMKFKAILEYIFMFSCGVLLAAGFWYMKNLILYGNPVYPFYFGHSGFSEREYLDMVNTIKLFVVDRNIINFIRLPFLFFVSPYYIFILISFLSWPISLWLLVRNKEHRDVSVYVSIYIFVYLIIWFFLATHQVRFAMVPIVLLFIFFGVLIDWIFTRVLRVINEKLFFTIIFLSLIISIYPVIHSKNNYLVDVKETELAYITGVYTKADFYNHRKLGTAYNMSKHIGDTYTDTNFLNVWSTSPFFLDKGNTFVSVEPLYYTDEFNTSTLLQFLTNRRVNYVLFDNYERSQAFNEPVRIHNPSYVAYRDFIVSVEDILKKSSIKIFEQYDVEIYKLDSIAIE